MDSFLLVIQWQELAGILPNVVSAVKSNQKMVVFVSRLKKSFQGVSYIFAFWLHSSQTQGRDHIPLVQRRLMHRIVEAQTNSDSCQRPTVSFGVSRSFEHIYDAKIIANLECSCGTGYVIWLLCCSASVMYRTKLREHNGDSESLCNCVTGKNGWTFYEATIYGQQIWLLCNSIVFLNCQFKWYCRYYRDIISEIWSQFCSALSQV